MTFSPSLPESTSKASWKGRPPGIPSSVPPPALPLTFLGTSLLGLIACGTAWILAAKAAVGDPTADSVVASVHLGMLATLSMGVMGALHQFIPVVTQRGLRSTRLAWSTFATWVLAAWLIPIGIASEKELIVEVGGFFAGIAVVLFVVNVSKALLAKGKGPPVAGMRLAVLGFVITACFGVLYVSDRKESWFVLSGHVVLAHALIGLFGWLGLTYISVSEKLWPMFMLAKVPGKKRISWVAIVAVPIGVLSMSIALLIQVVPFFLFGIVLTEIGLIGHVSSLSTWTFEKVTPL